MRPSGAARAPATEVLGPDEGLATLTGRIDAARQEKDQHVARQKAALAQLQALGLQGDAFSLQATSLYGSARWKVAVFADMDALRQDGAMLDDAAWRRWAALRTRVLPQNRRSACSP
ncbi:MULTISPECIES: hypothetical protein [Achromobacter]|uniref:hypothetical protein n=1 Tax=Achromobacter TaxID=222 RepID=UPI0025BAA774|nr:MULTISPECIES: hypothetical protein [Achromobacter]